MEGLGEEAGLGLSETDCHLQGQLALSSGLLETNGQVWLKCKRILQLVYVSMGQNFNKGLG